MSYTSCVVNLPPFLLNAEAKYDTAPVPAFQKNTVDKKNSHNSPTPVSVSEKVLTTESGMDFPPIALRRRRCLQKKTLGGCGLFANGLQSRGRRQKTERSRMAICIHCILSRCVRCHDTKCSSTRDKRQITPCTVQILCDMFQII